MSGRVPSEMTDVTDPKVIIDEECTDSGYLSGIVSETLSGDVSGDLRAEQTSATLSQSLSRVNISSSVESRPLAHDLPPWQLLFQHDDEGDTQLHIAAIRGCLNSVRTLVSVCPARELLDFPNDYGQTALHLAVLAGHRDVTETLVREGAKIDCRDCMGDSPLHVAATSGNNSCMKALLEPLPTKKPHFTAATLNQKNFNGETSIHCAAQNGHTDLVQTLVYYGADINARCAHYICGFRCINVKHTDVINIDEGLGGYTALHVAAERGDAALAAYLLERCPGAAVGELDYAGRTARRLAAGTRAAAVFARNPLRDDEDYQPSDDDDSEDESDMDSALSFFSKLRDGMDHSIPVA